MIADIEHAALLEQIAAELRERPHQRNWIAQFRDCDALPLSRAADMAGADPETIRRWCIATEYTDHPLGYLVGGMWLVDMPELMRQLETRRGKRAREAAEARLEKYREEQTTKLLG
ncbi:MULTISPECIES: hypothetical protein [unclassified Bradyrhizobium]|uniref:hypothetical protein n=1 Tax=unclassified Bradyrhizobium TaxID=2631580 RepID=UPI001FF9ED15|nr:MULTISPECIES: hypothetical protein [unclassified Bradyrhizobium]MCK1607246.1 hypothetical protein [Bradyrhizobium sp. 166]UPJ29277.1 hypothetical protein IVB54_09740 [Bradyrhizobium sp. CW1]